VRIGSCAGTLQSKLHVKVSITLLLSVKALRREFQTENRNLRADYQAIRAKMLVRFGIYQLLSGIMLGRIPAGDGDRIIFLEPMESQFEKQRRLQQEQSGLPPLDLASIVALFHVYALSGISAFSAFGKYLSPHFAVRSFFVISGYSSTEVIRVRPPSGPILRSASGAFTGLFAVIACAALGLYVVSPLPASRYFGAQFWQYSAPIFAFSTSSRLRCPAYLLQTVTRQ